MVLLVCLHTTSQRGYCPRNRSPPSQRVLPGPITLPVASITSNSAVFNGTLTANGADTLAWFEYGSTTNYGSLTSTTNISSGDNSPAMVIVFASGLTSGTRSYYQLVASNSLGASLGGDATFGSLGPPTVTTLAASGVLPASATLNGMVTPNGFDSLAWFQYGTTTNYGGSTSALPVASTNLSPVTVSSQAIALAPGTLYHFRLLGGTPVGTNIGADVIFTTPPPSAPVATTLSANAVINAAAIAGAVAPNGADSSVSFQFGPTTNYGSTTPPMFINGTNFPTVTVSNLIAGLAPGALYHFRVLASNNVGVSIGTDATFTTLSAGHALHFDGSSGYVNIPNFGNSLPTNEITVEFWQRVTYLKDQSTFSLNSDIYTNRFNAHVPLSDGNVYWDFGNINTLGRLSYTPLLPITGSWQHFALVSSQSGNFMAIYQNGLLVTNRTGMTPLTRGNYNLELGVLFTPYPSITYYFAGDLDEVRIWNTARSASRIQASMNYSLSGNEAGLVAYWRFDEGTGTTTADATGHGLNGTLVAGTTWGDSTAPIHYLQPFVSTFPASSLMPASVVLNGAVSPGGSNATYWFQYGTTTNYGSNAPPINLSATNPPRLSR